MKILHVLGEIFVIVLVFQIAAKAQSVAIQIQGSNRLEYRLTKKNQEETFNDWLDVDYNLNNFTTGLRLELHQPSDPSGSSEKISQRYFVFEKNWLRFRVGNFYKRLGKGLIFQAFELQNIVLDRIEQSFVVDRNVDGFLLQVSHPQVDLALLSGRPLWSKRNGKTGVVRGGECQFRLSDRLLLGGSYLRINEADSKGPFKTELSSGHVGLSLQNVDVYVEYARREVPADRPFKPGKALYFSTNLYGQNFGLSMEYKNYRNFSSAYNNPPTLVKQHLFTLLNRHTHVLLADDEVGFQIEAIYTPWISTSFVANFSRAGNHRGDPNYEFQEIYGELKQDWSEKLVTKLAYDRSKDRLVGDKDRITSALEMDYFIDARNSLLIDVQTQRIKKVFGATEYDNYLFLIGFSYSPFLTISFQFERSTDPYSQKKKWAVFNLNLKIDENHELFLSYGARRAGLVCSGGYCQLIPEFEGIELRLNSRF